MAGPVPILLFAALPLLALAPAAPALQADAPAPHAIQEFPVVAYNRQFTPEALVIPAGSTVTWTHVVGDHEIATTNSLLDGLADNANDPADTNCAVDGEPGEDNSPDTCVVFFTFGAVSLVTFSHTFASPGVFPYYCRTHFATGMHAVIVVA